jgi:plastocyanin
LARGSATIETFRRHQDTYAGMHSLKDFSMRPTVRSLPLLLSLALAGTLPAPASAAGREAVVTMANMKFGSIPSGLKVGDSITFVNKDSVPHTVTARDHSFDLRIAPGQKGRVTLTKAGTIAIYCILHSPMRGTLSVAAK